MIAAPTKMGLMDEFLRMRDARFASEYAVLHHSGTLSSNIISHSNQIDIYQQGLERI